MTEIALIRHAPTDWNGSGRLQGRTDRPLTDAARAELATLALPPPWHGSRLISSTLARAVETARLLAPGQPVETDPRLVELSFGAWEGQQAADLLAQSGSGFRPTGEWGWEDKAPGGESARDAWDRLRPALAEIASDGQRAILVLHKALMRIILGFAWAPDPAPEVKRRRLYPLRLSGSGQPGHGAVPIRLLARP